MSGFHRRFRRIGLAGVMFLPNFLKKPAYRLIFGYKIAPGVRIGFSYIDCQKLEIGADCRIGHGVVFSNCGDVKLGQKVRIGPLNMFRGGSSVVLDDYAELLRMNVINSLVQMPEYRRAHQKPVCQEFFLGYGSVITANHKIDFTDRVTIGRHTVLGGRSSSLWTHNRGDNGEISIGSYCYIGSEIRVAPGASIPDMCVVGLGSVVLASKTFTPYTLIAGNPASVKRRLTEKDNNFLFGPTRHDLPDEEPPAIPQATEAAHTS